MTETIEIKVNNAFEADFIIVDENDQPSTIFNGLDWKLTVKNLTDVSATDTTAVITKTGTVSGSTISIAFTAAETNILQKVYKCDFRINDTSPFNTDRFQIKITDTVTKTL